MREIARYLDVGMHFYMYVNISNFIMCQSDSAVRFCGQLSRDVYHPTREMHLRLFHKIYLKFISLRTTNNFILTTYVCYLFFFFLTLHNLDNVGIFIETFIKTTRNTAYLYVSRSFRYHCRVLRPSARHTSVPTRQY